MSEALLALTGEVRSPDWWFYFLSIVKMMLFQKLTLKNLLHCAFMKHVCFLFFGEQMFTLIYLHYAFLCQSWNFLEKLLLTLLHTERPNLIGILAVLSVTGLNSYHEYFIMNSLTICICLLLQYLVQKLQDKPLRLICTCSDADVRASISFLVTKIQKL